MAPQWRTFIYLLSLIFFIKRHTKGIEVYKFMRLASIIRYAANLVLKKRLRLCVQIEFLHKPKEMAVK